MSTIQNLRKSLVRNWRPVCSVVGDAVSGAEPAPFPSPLPPASGRAGPVRSQLALLWSFSVPLFCEWPALCLGRLIFSLSLAVPQFKLLSHKSSLQLPSGRALRPGPYPKQCRPLLFHAGVWGTFLLGVAFRHVICGFYLFFLPVRLPSEI